MLRKRNLLMCVVAVTFCLVTIESAEAYYDSYWLVDCYEDYYGNFWVCWWDCYNCCFEWICLEDRLLTLFLDSHVVFEKDPFAGINDDNIYAFRDGGDILRDALPFMGSEPQNRTDNLLAYE